MKAQSHDVYHDRQGQGQRILKGVSSSKGQENRQGGNTPKAED